MRALVVAGSGRYADPWHDFAAVAARVASLLADDGWDLRVDDDVDGALAQLDGVDLLVVAAGDPWGKGARGFGAPAEAVAGLESACARGLGVLGLHTAVASLRDYAVWAPLLGAVWVPGASMHPEMGPADVRILPHPVTAGIGDFTLVDERYSYLQPVGERSVLAYHEHDGLRHPIVWVREHGPARAAYDALGHHPGSFDSREHRELLLRLARWAGGGHDGE